MVSIQNCNRGTGLSYFGEIAILYNILSRLPIKSLMRFKSVCTDWKLLIEKDSNLINLQLTRSESDVNRTSLLVLPLHKPRCVGAAETKIILFSGEEKEEEKDENRSSSGEVVIPHELLLSCRNIIDTDFRVPIGVEMLKPVNGLVCFVNDVSGSVLIYNPSTRQTTCWIKTNIQIEKEEECSIDVPGTYESKVWSCCYGFGFDPITREHKVVCVNKISILPRFVGNVVSCVHNEIICEVLTVGENRWRKIDEVPPLPYMVGSAVYIDGYIYWMGSRKPSTQSDVILGFDVGSEKFDRVIKIPNFMLDLWCFKKNKRVSRMLVFELVVIDGQIAIIDREGESWINLWIYNENDGNGGDCNWTKQEMAMPYVWDGTGCLALEHIAGTDIIMVKGTPKPLEYCFYYNREKKEYCSKPVKFICSTKASSYPYCSQCPGRGYKVTSFSQTLFPVQTK